jgi:hypothetical protein
MAPQIYCFTLSNTTPCPGTRVGSQAKRRLAGRGATYPELLMALQVLYVYLLY